MNADFNALPIITELMFVMATHTKYPIQRAMQAPWPNRTPVAMTAIKHSK